MASIKRLSLVDQVYEKLKEEIVTLKIPFGSKLNVSKLQEEYGVSSTPVREAMNRLLNDGLIELENNVGARVIDLTDDDVRQIQEVSLAYEMLAARNALRFGDIKEMAEEIWQYIEEYRKTKDILESCRCIRNILNVFYKNANNDMLIAQVTSMNVMDQILHSLFSMPYEKTGHEGQYHSGIIYFERIHDGVCNKDFPGICDAMEDHKIWSGEYILRNLAIIKQIKQKEVS